MQKITIIGAGLIGASIARSYRAAAPNVEIIAIDVSDESLDLLLEENIINAGFAKIEQAAITDANIIIIATPLQCWVDVAAALKQYALEAQLIIDVGSVKQYALSCFADLPNFVPTHPIAGSEFSGAAFSTPDLFQQKRVIIIAKNPQILTEAENLAVQFWQELGAYHNFLTADAHDLIYAYVSHLPQLAAFAMASDFLRHLSAESLDANAHNFYRLCGSSPSLWSGIFKHNPHLLNAAETLLQLVNHMIAELKTGELNDESTDIARGLKLTPRIVASCLISVVNLAEKKHEMSLARYAGAGFADMTHPAMTDPAQDLELISKHCADVIACLHLYEQKLRDIILALKSDDITQLNSMLHDSFEAYQRFIYDV
jgi:prephenate dehydrogenase